MERSYRVVLESKHNFAKASVTRHKCRRNLSCRQARMLYNGGHLSGITQPQCSDGRWCLGGLGTPGTCPLTAAAD
ncbi:hypothetical protein GN956_G25165 [Arapaima gigas]